MKIIDLYTDGSYPEKIDPTITRGGYVVVDNETQEPVSLRKVFSRDSIYVKSRNSGGEIIAAMMGFQDSLLRLGNEEKCILNIFYDYKGVKEFITGGWGADKTSSKIYVAVVMPLLKEYPNVQLKWYWIKSHQTDLSKFGVKYNKLADQIAGDYVPPEYRHLEKDIFEFGLE